MPDEGPDILDLKPDPDEGGLGRAFLAGDGFTKAEGLDGDGNADLWSLLGAGNLEAGGLAIEENFGIPEDFNGVAEVEGSIAVSYAQGVYGQPKRREQPMMRCRTRRKLCLRTWVHSMPALCLASKPLDYGRWSARLTSVADVPPTRPWSKRGSIIGFDTPVRRSSRCASPQVHKDCGPLSHLLFFFALHSIATGIHKHSRLVCVTDYTTYLHHLYRKPLGS
jgi:hypothetical protein